MTSTAPLGLLLDVDGPISSTRTRTLRLDSLAADIAAIARSGCPVVFNTGRSVDFLGDQILPRLVSAGLRHTDPVWGIGEKGGTWFSLADDGIGEIHEDHSLTPPAELIAAAREVAEQHSDVVFFDETKRTMISLEQHVDVPSDVFLDRRPAIIASLEDRIAQFGVADTMAIYPTFIAVDVEHRNSGKALGARRALDLLGSRMTPPSRWFTAGDSGQDYDMAASLHEQGFEVTHLDVRIEGEARQTPFDVVRELPGAEAEDDITARHIAALRAEIGA